MSILYPLKTGLKPTWKRGDVGLKASHGFPHCYVLDVDERWITYLDSSGTVNSCHPQDILTIEGAKKHCDYMCRDWTGRQYDDTVDLLDGGFPFILPHWWPEALERAMEPYV